MSKNDSKGKELESLANKVNEQMTRNKYLNKQLEKYILLNNLSKDIMTKSIQDKNISLVALFKEYSEIIRKDKEKYKNDYEKKTSKYNALKENYIDYATTENISSAMSNKGFILNHLLIEKNNIINSLKNSIKK